MNTNQAAANQERTVRVQNGWVMLVLLAGLLIGDVALLIHFAPYVPALLVLPVIIVLLTGFFTLQPNEACVLVLFGAYRGTVRENGFHWGNPFYSLKPATAATAATSKRSAGRNKISLRARTLNGETLKVNDKRGNPIEIAAVVVWRVADTAQALFDVDVTSTT